MCTYLDATPPTLTPAALDLHALLAVGDTLEALAAMVPPLHHAVSRLKTELVKARDLTHAPEAVEAAAAAMARAHVDLDVALGEWQAAG